LQCSVEFRSGFGTALSKEFFMSVLSNPVEANSYLGSFIVESLNGTLIVLSALLALATVAVVA